jgi:hypothetical protein
LALACSSLHAADIYVWTDESGRRQISDVVPDKYRARARIVAVPVQPEQARSAASGGTAAPEPEQTPPASAATDCNLRWQLYFDARECFDFYEYALRGLDADPRASCPVVPAAPRDCAPPATGISSR